ncbi:nudix family hydrolase [Gigaspora margarita]|uniref:Nudix family hydrolase n=1 Tax=Gigaspora margarita TaxID=4874 RepID=A0A8H4AKS5_GIGMA|nr:nudix family hydrolase [Gigaspora margarita]
MYKKSLHSCFARRLSPNIHYSWNTLLIRRKFPTANFIYRSMSDAKTSVNIGGSSVPITVTQQSIEVASILKFKPFEEWVSTLSNKVLTADKKELEINKIEIQNVDYFGSKIGFIKFKVDAKLIENGKSVPGIVFMRGGAVAVLLILRSKDPNDQVLKEHVVITYQPRLPVPSLNFPEIPAGMLDGSGNFTGKASEEIKEETGIEIRDQDLIDLTELAYGDKYRGAYPSPGGCDEFIRLCLCIKEMDHKEVKSLEGKLCGLRDHGESITVGLVELDYLWKIPDMKALSALTLYDALKKNGKL